MIITNLKGGLGNQMFQYALGKSLAERNQVPLKLDINFLQSAQAETVTKRHFELSLFNISAVQASSEEIRRYKNLFSRVLQKAMPRYHGNRYIQEGFFQFDPRILKVSGNHYLEGHWMSEKYFQDIAPVIRREFAFKQPVIEAARPLEASIRSSNAVCVHIRRGDYVNNPTVTSVHGVTPLEYFIRAIDLIREQVTNPEFFVFSDDSNWCYENLKHLSPIRFVEKELTGVQATNSDFLQLMASCKHFIISNSTYSWWGAWLAQHPDKTVIAPKKWFNVTTIDTSDICPSSWIRI